MTLSSTFVDQSRTPAVLRRKLTVGELEAAGNALVRFVGVEAYEAAGGVVRRDLFDDEQSRFLSDPALLQRLASEKLDALAVAVREQGRCILVCQHDRAALQCCLHWLMPEQPGTWFAWLIALPQAQLLDLLALCTALTLSALPSTGAAGDANVLAEAVGLDMADWWEPTAGGYLNHVPKAQIVQALKEAGPDLADDAAGAMKKDVLVVKAASRLAGKRWQPAL